MRRRHFIAVLGSAAAWPLVARAQQPAPPVIGIVYHGAPDAGAVYINPIRKGLGDGGYIEGRNLTIEYRWTFGDERKLPELMADLVRRRVSVIVATGNVAVVRAAKAATTTIPIVFNGGGDPVQLGIVAQINRPGGNVTGTTTMNVDIGSKLLGLMRELLPRASRLAILVNPANPAEDSYVADLRAAASTIAWQIEIVSAGANRELAPAFASLAEKGIDALLVRPDTFLLSRRVQIVTLAARHAVPAIYPTRDWAEAGGLMSYGANIAEMWRQTGIYAARILNGDRPADLPIMRPTKFEFIINLATAEAIGIEIPPTLRAQADQVIE